MKRFDELYEKYATEVHRFAWWLSGNSADAEDITSETFVRAWIGRETIRTETVKAYLFTIARNIYLKKQRKSWRIQPLDEQLSHPAKSPEQMTELREAVQQLRLDVMQLNEEERTALILRAVYQLPYVEIARVLKISLSAAKVKVYRARRKLLLEKTR